MTENKRQTSQVNSSTYNDHACPSKLRWEDDCEMNTNKLAMSQTSGLKCIR